MKFYSPITLENWTDLLHSKELVINYINGEFVIELNDSLIAEIPAIEVADQLKKDDYSFYKQMSFNGEFELDTFNTQDYKNLEWARTVMLAYFECVKGLGGVNL